MNTATNPKTGEPLKKTKKVLIYGLSETETAQVQDNLPNADIEVMDCTGCFTDIIAHAYIAVIMNPDMLETEDIANDVGTVLFGKEAVECGLIDGLGGISEAIDALEKMIESKKM